MSDLASKLNAHEGQACAIYGKGPSLFTHDFAQDPHVRICVNDAGYIVPHPTYVMMHDPFPHAEEILRRCVAWCPTVTLVLPSCGQHTDGVRFVDIVERIGIDPESVVWYVKRWGLCHRREDHAEAGTLWGGKGTGTSAVHFSHLCGCDRVRLVAFDGKMVPTAEEYARQFPAAAPGVMRGAEIHGSNFVPAQTHHYSRIARILDGLMAFFGQEKI